MRYKLKLSVLLGVILGSLFTINVEAQGPFTSQIQRALNALLANGAAFTHASSITVNGNAATPTAGLTLANATLSTAGVPVQMPPCLYLNGNVWNTTAVAANNTDSWSVCSLPVSGATPSGLLKFGSSLNGAAATSPFDISSSGFVHVNDIRAFSGNSISVAASGAFGWIFSTTGALYNQGTGGSAGDLGLVGTPVGVLYSTTANATAAYKLSGIIAISGTAPTIASGGCTTGSAQSISASNGTAAFSVTLGGATCGNTITLTMPTASTNWSSCYVNDLTAAAAHVAYNPRVISSTSTQIVVENQTTSTGAAVALNAADVLHFVCMGK